MQTSLNPLQGGFRTDFSCLHSCTFILREVVTSLREKEKKVYVAFNDIKTVFGTMV